MKMKFECEKTEQKIHTAQTELLREEEHKINVQSVYTPRDRIKSINAFCDCNFLASDVCVHQLLIFQCVVAVITPSRTRKKEIACVIFLFSRSAFFSNFEEHCTNRFVVHEYCIVRCTGCNANENENEHRIYFMFIQYFNFDYLKKHLEQALGVSKFLAYTERCLVQLRSRSV